MKKTVLIIVMSLFAFGADAAELKLGYVDLQKVIDLSDAGKAAVKKLDDMVKTKKVAINEKNAKIKSIEEELAKQASILTPESIKEKKEEREKLMRDLQRMIKDSQEDVQKKQNELMRDMMKEIQKIVLDIGKDQGYTAIIDRVGSATLYVDETVDITGLVVKKFNELSKEPKKE